MSILRRGRFVMLLLAALAVGGLVFSYFGRRTHPPGPATAAFLDDHHDFGKVRAGAPLTYTFEFVNAGQGSLTIRSIQSSCGCLAAAGSGDRFAPGEKGSIRVSLSTKGVPAPAEVRKKVTVVFEGGGMLSVPLTVAAEVRPEVRVDPAEIRLRRDPSVPIVAHKVVVAREMLSPEAFSKLRLETPPSVTAKEEWIGEEERAYVLTFATATMPVFPAPVEVVCGEGADAERVPIRLFISDAPDGVRLAPSLFYASFSRATPADEALRQAARSFILRSDGGDDVAVEKLEGDEHWLAWSIRPGPRPLAFDVRLKAVPPGDVYSSVLMVYYTAGRGRSRGKLPIDVRVVVTPR